MFHGPNFSFLEASNNLYLFLNYEHLPTLLLQLKPNLDKEHDPMAGIMGLMKVKTPCGAMFLYFMQLSLLLCGLLGSSLKYGTSCAEHVRGR